MWNEKQNREISYFYGFIAVGYVLKTSLSLLGFYECCIITNGE